MKPTLRVFITENCPGCDEAHTVVAKLRQEHPDFPVEMIDIAHSTAVVPEAVFATPTFMLGDRIVSLGNPSPEQINHWIEELALIQAEC